MERPKISLDFLLKSVSQIHAKDTPLMKLLFTNGFSPLTSTHEQIKGGLIRLDKLFIDQEKVAEVIEDLKTIDISCIDEKISIIKQMRESLNQMIKPMLPDKDRVKRYLLQLYREKIVAIENSNLAKYQIDAPD